MSQIGSGQPDIRRRRGLAGGDPLAGQRSGAINLPNSGTGPAAGPSVAGQQLIETFGQLSSTVTTAAKAAASIDAVVDTRRRSRGTEMFLEQAESIREQIENGEIEFDPEGDPGEQAEQLFSESLSGQNPVTARRIRELARSQLGPVVRAARARAVDQTIAAVRTEAIGDLGAGNITDEDGARIRALVTNLPPAQQQAALREIVLGGLRVMANSGNTEDFNKLAAQFDDVDPAAVSDLRVRLEGRVEEAERDMRIESERRARADVSAAVNAGDFQSARDRANHIENPDQVRLLNNLITNAENASMRAQFAEVSERADRAVRQAVREGWDANQLSVELSSRYESAPDTYKDSVSYDEFVEQHYMSAASGFVSAGAPKSLEGLIDTVPSSQPGLRGTLESMLDRARRERGQRDREAFQVQSQETYKQQITDYANRLNHGDVTVYADLTTPTVFSDGQGNNYKRTPGEKRQAVYNQLAPDNPHRLHILSDPGEVRDQRVAADISVAFGVALGDVSAEELNTSDDPRFVRAREAATRLFTLATNMPNPHALAAQAPTDAQKVFVSNFIRYAQGMPNPNPGEALRIVSSVQRKGGTLPNADTTLINNTADMVNEHLGLKPSEANNRNLIDAISTILPYRMALAQSNEDATKGLAEDLAKSGSVIDGAFAYSGGVNLVNDESTLGLVKDFVARQQDVYGVDELRVGYTNGRYIVTDMSGSLSGYSFSHAEMLEIHGALVHMGQSTTAATQLYGARRKAFMILGTPEPDYTIPYSDLVEQPHYRPEDIQKLNYPNIPDDYVLGPDVSPATEAIVYDVRRLTKRNTMRILRGQRVEGQTFGQLRDAQERDRQREEQARQRRLGRGSMAEVR